MPFIDVKSLSLKEPRAGWQGRFFHSAEMTFGYYSVTAGSSIHEHAHENDEVWNVIEGELAITVAGQAKRLGPGEVAVVPPNALHSVTAITNARAIVVDHPRRDSIGGVGLV